MITPIRALYDKVEDQVAELKKYLVFYNSEVFTIGPIINGITCSMEEARANGENVTAKDINSVRTSSRYWRYSNAGNPFPNLIWNWMLNGIRWKLSWTNFRDSCI